MYIWNISSLAPISNQASVFSPLPLLYPKHPPRSCLCLLLMLSHVFNHHQSLLSLFWSVPQTHGSSFSPRNYFLPAQSRLNWLASASKGVRIHWVELRKFVPMRFDLHACSTLWAFLATMLHGVVLGFFVFLARINSVFFSLFLNHYTDEF